MNERLFTKTIIDAAREQGWLTAHFGNSVKIVRAKDGYKTIPDKDATGFPDCVFARPGRLVIAELKAAKGRVTPAQAVWLATLKSVPNLEVYTWRCGESWDEIEEVLA